MAKWVVLADTMTSKGHPREFGILNGDGTRGMMHYVAAERSGGGADDTLPRRLMGLGRDRESARASLDATVSEYDPMGTVVYRR